MFYKALFRKTAIALLALTVLSACGKKGGEVTQASMSVKMASALTSSTLVAGGVMVYGKSDLGHVMAFNVYNGHDVIELENGAWQFWGIGWEGPNAFEGNVRCGTVSAALEGGDAVIDLTISMPGCLN